MVCRLATMGDYNCPLIELEAWEVHRSGVILLTMVRGITLLRKITAQEHSFILMDF